MVDLPQITAAEKERGYSRPQARDKEARGLFKRSKSTYKAMIIESLWWREGREGEDWVRGITINARGSEHE